MKIFSPVLINFSLILVFFNMIQVKFSIERINGKGG